MSLVAHPLNILFAKTFIEKELEFVDNNDVLYEAFIATQPKSEWEGVDREVVIERSKSKKNTCSKLITRYRQSIQDISHYNLSSILSELDEARDIAKEDRNAPAMISATMGKAKVTGHIVNKVENTHKGSIDLKQEIRNIPVEFLARAGLTMKDVTDSSKDLIEVDK